MAEDFFALREELLVEGRMLDEVSGSGLLRKVRGRWHGNRSEHQRFKNLGASDNPTAASLKMLNRGCTSTSVLESHRVSSFY